jgi:hypothetical protein
MRLPEALVGHTGRPEFSSLASRDLYRGHAVQLPCGEAVAQAMRVKPYNATESQTANAELSGGTPLWLYVLAEAEAHHKGEFLGPVGGQIVAEVIYELLRHDPDSFLKQPGWTPELAGAKGAFGIADLLLYAGVA